MRHCPECRRVYGRRVDLCPLCWAELQSGAPPEPRRLSLVYEATAIYEADMIETLLRNEGIPCLVRPGSGALPWPLAGALPCSSLRLYVRADMAPQATDLIAEITGSPGEA